MVATIRRHPSTGEAHTTWVADSGSTDHITGDIRFFASIERLATPVDLHLPDGSTVSVKEKGTVRMRLPTAQQATRKSDGDIDVTLQDVLYAPSVTEPLLSLLAIGR